MVLICAFALACGDDGGGGEDAADTVEPTGGGSATGDGPTSNGGSGDASGSATTTDPTAGSASGGSGDTSGSDSGSGGLLAECGEATCAAGEVCVNPCCGGAPLPCLDAQNDGTCLPTQTPVDPNECSIPCLGDTCCLPGPCTPDPPFCADAKTLMCNGDDCMVPECGGLLEDGQLECLCA